MTSRPNPGIKSPPPTDPTPIPSSSQFTNLAVSSPTPDSTADSIEDSTKTKPTSQPRRPSPKDLQTPLEPLDWSELESRYEEKMMEFSQEELGASEEFERWIRLFESWASVTTTHEVERGRKRLCTRISYVQNQENDLESKRVHYQRVVKAFESALLLLSSS